MCMELITELLDSSMEPREESVVVPGSTEYLDHHGGVHTPLLRPSTITEKGVDLGCVIGGQTTEGTGMNITYEEGHTPQLGPGSVTDETDLGKVNSVLAARTLMWTGEEWLGWRTFMTSEI